MVSISLLRYGGLAVAICLFTLINYFVAKFALWLPEKIITTIGNFIKNFLISIIFIFLMIMTTGLMIFLILNSDTSTEITTHYVEECTSGKFFSCIDFTVSFSVENIYTFFHIPFLQRQLWFFSSYGKDPCNYIQFDVGEDVYASMSAKLPIDYERRYAECATHYWLMMVYRMVGQYACDVYLGYHEDPFHPHVSFACGVEYLAEK